jgi:hypothetical protein
MANVTPIEMMSVAKLFQMELGYVLEFSNPEFDAFVYDAVGIDITEEKYKSNGTSKAKRLKAFIKLEDDAIVAILLEKLFEFWLEKCRHGEYNSSSYEYAFKSVEDLIAKLKRSDSFESYSALNIPTSDQTFEKLKEELTGLLASNKPEMATDRMHTFLFKYLKNCLDKHGEEYKDKETLNSLYGKYVKVLIKKNLIETEMSDKILAYFTNVMDAYNKVRNNHSLAHDNQLISKNEATFILRILSAMVSFIRGIEDKEDPSAKADNNTNNGKLLFADNDELPF